MSTSTQQPESILKEVFGYESFRSHQAPIIRRVIDGGDALVVMPTGGGKSLCYQIPAMAREGVAIVVCPLIALMQDQVEALRQAGVRAAFVNSTLPPDIARQIEDDMVRGAYDLIYVAPERLLTPNFLNLLDRTPLALFAIDEAHCVSQWGHDFRPEYLGLSVLHERFPDVPRMALTATADEPTRREIIERLDFDAAGVFIAGFDRPNIRYRVVLKTNARQQLLRFVQREHTGEAGIVYCMSRRKVEQTAEFLKTEGIEALPYHAGMAGDQRARHQQRFLREPGVVMVATIAFGMGIDKPDVRFVAHMDLPKSLESYYQETGRAGRDGLPAEAWMCYGYGDAVAIRQFIERSEAGADRKRLEHQKLNALLGYCETTGCHRNVLLRYFGESPDADCGNCSTCLEPVETWDGTTAAQKALSCVYRTGQSYGATHLAGVLVGSDEEKIWRAGHDKVSTYGIGDELDRKGWMSVYRQLVAAGLIGVHPEHGGLYLNEASGPVLRGESEIRFRKDPKPARTKKAPKSKTAAAVDAQLDDPGRELFDALRTKRLELAREQSIPPYVIFHDATLLAMVRGRPADLEEMGEIHGVGRSKLKKFGKIFLEVIREHAG